MWEEMAGDAISTAFEIDPCVDSNTPKVKRKRNLPGNPDPGAEVVALSPSTLMATNQFVCEICGKGFPREQNLQLHRRGHNLPSRLKQRSSKEIRKKVYVCPEKSCVHHDPARALGDLTGIKKHFCRKHGEKKWNCDKCSKKYGVESDWKFHSRTCGTRGNRCECGLHFSRRDSFDSHRAFCVALAEETARVSAAATILSSNIDDKTGKGDTETSIRPSRVPMGLTISLFPSAGAKEGNCESATSLNSTQHHHHPQPATVSMPSMAWLQKPAQIGANSTAPSFLQRPGMNDVKSLELPTLDLQDGNNLNRMFNLSPMATNFATNIESSSPLKQLAMLQSSEKVDLKEGGGEQTRDFLEVGFQPICPLMDSRMNLNTKDIRKTYGLS